MKGQIKCLVPLRGFGFIRAENGEDVFFHLSACRGSDFDTQQEGTHVEFDQLRGLKGLRTVYVTVAK